MFSALNNSKFHVVYVHNITSLAQTRHCGRTPKVTASHISPAIPIGGGAVVTNEGCIRWKFSYLNALYDTVVSRLRHFLFDCAIAIEVADCQIRQQSAVKLCSMIKKAEAIRTTVVPISIHICKTVVPIRILIRTTGM